MKPTPEQQAIVNCKFGNTDIIKVLAFAGTGKTSTLKLFADANPRLKMLYIAFNKSVQLEAERKFPRNVECRTSHSLAYRNFGSRYKDKMCRGSLKVKDVAYALNTNRYDIANHVMKTMMAFIASADPKISKKHLPPEAKAMEGRKPMDGVPFEPAPDFVAMATQLWSMMIDERDGRVQMLHDGYLKLWQLSGPRLNYDVILLDEAQDINPATADVALKQNCVRVLVGDTHQQIYSFRGADNILAKIKAQHNFHLTQSFRFGRKIGEVASLILKNFKGEKLPVVGLNGESVISTIKDGAYASISRTNAFVFDQAVNLYKTKRLHFVGGVWGYGFEQILDTYYLWNGQRGMIKDRYIASFNSFVEMRAFAQEVEDVELLCRAIIVEKYAQNIPIYVNEITRSAVELAKDADVVLTTAHKAKGLEFRQVRLTDDFPELIEEDKEKAQEGEFAMKLVSKSELAADEFNLIYVAATRAEQLLEPNPRLLRFIDFVGAGDLVEKEEVV